MINSRPALGLGDGVHSLTVWKQFSTLQCYTGCLQARTNNRTRLTDTRCVRRSLRSFMESRNKSPLTCKSEKGEIYFSALRAPPSYKCMTWQPGMHGPDDLIQHMNRDAAVRDMIPDHSASVPRDVLTESLQELHGVRRCYNRNTTTCPARG
jgi:hypothetical protein